MELLAVLILYFTKTTPRQRENALVVMWILLILPAGYFFMVLIGSALGAPGY